MRTNTLRAALLALLLVLAGCNGGGGSATTAPEPTLASGPATTDTPATTDDGSTPASGPADGLALQPRTAQGERFLELAAGNDVRIRGAATVNGTFRVFYEVGNPSEDVSRRGFQVALAYATVVNDTWASNASWNATAMEATAVTEDGAPVASYRMPAYWGRQVRSSEVFTESWLGRRLDTATSRVYANGTLSNVSGNTTDFAVGLQRVFNDSDPNVTAVTRRGGTVYVTLETATDNETRLKQRFARVVGTYGAFAFRGWDPDRVELTVVRPGGDTYGWYHIERIRALNAYRNRATAPIQLAFDTFVPEHDGLDGNEST